MVVWLHAGICSIVGRDINTLTLFLETDKVGYSYQAVETGVFVLKIFTKTPGLVTSSSRGCGSTVKVLWK